MLTLIISIWHHYFYIKISYCFYALYPFQKDNHIIPPIPPLHILDLRKCIIVKSISIDFYDNIIDNFGIQHSEFWIIF